MMNSTMLLKVAAGVVVFGLAGFSISAAAMDDSDELSELGLPPDAGREEVEIYCGPCHSLKLVAQQGLSREGWEETIDWMVAEQEMPPLDPEDRQLVLDYLSKHVSVEAFLERRNGQ